MSETDLMRALQKQATKLGARLFRQNAGMGWIGAAVKFSDRRQFTAEPGDVLIRNARPFHAGVQGMSDLGGWVLSRRRDSRARESTSNAPST